MKNNRLQAQNCSIAQQKKKGFTLTEIAIVLGIIGLILGAVWSAASGVYASANASSFSTTMAQYIAAVRAACSGSCTAVPTVSVSIPNLANSNVSTSTTPPFISTNNPGYIVLTYNFPATMSKVPTAVATGLIAAANATGSAFGVGVDSLNTVTPKCAAAGTPTCSAPTASCSSGYTCSYIGSATCTGANTPASPAGSCSQVFNGTVAASTAYQFEFAPTY